MKYDFGLLLMYSLISAIGFWSVFQMAAGAWRNKCFIIWFLVTAAMVLVGAYTIKK